MNEFLELENVATKDFRRSLTDLYKKGGEASRVAQQVNALIGGFGTGVVGPHKFTRSGESRIKNCVKYDFKDGQYRLVTLEQAGRRWLLFVGNHSEADRWLDNHKNTRLLSAGQRLSFSKVSPTIEEAPVTPPTVLVEDLTRPLFTRVPAELIDQLDLPQEVREMLAQLNRDNYEEVLQSVLDQVPSVPYRVVFALIDAAFHLCKGEVSEAGDRIRLELGTAQPVESDEHIAEKALESGENSETLIRLRDLSESEFKKWLAPDAFEEWLLFLHPDQRKHVEANHDGPARVTGVSGSGKTVMVVHRARSLALQHPDEQILIVTLSQALAELIERLCAKLCTGDELARITVMPMYALCYEIATEFGYSEKDIRLIDPQSGEDVRVHSWPDFFNHRITKREHQEIISHFRLMGGGIDAARYLREELVWIRSAFHKSQRRIYLDADREGRSIPLSKKKWRPKVLALLDAWEDWMRAGGLLDPEGVSLLASEHVDRLKSSRFRFRAVLVDEAQDLSTLEFAILAQLPTDERNSLFLVGDAAQRVYPKQCSLSRGGISVTGRAWIIRKNYRNTRQTLEAAHAMISQFLSSGKAEPEGFEVLEPEYSTREGPKPRLLRFKSVADQASWVVDEIKGIRSFYAGAPICVVSARERTRHILIERLSSQGIEAAPMNQETWKSNVVLVSDFEEVKGFEFHTMIVCDVTSGILPSSGLPKEEWWRDACHLYVAMTRAREELALCVVGEPSPFVPALEKCVIQEKPNANTK